MIAPLPDLLIDPVVRAALAEDLGRAGDITALACIDADATTTRCTALTSIFSGFTPWIGPALTSS